MIRIIDGTNIDKYKDTVDAMYRVRAQVFSDRLGWDVVVKDGKEIDRFDACAPLYLVSVNPLTEQVEGSLRLLPTTGPNMLRDVFPELLPAGVVVESPVIWESSRFSINPDLSSDYGPARLNKITTELLHAIVEVGMMSGLDHVVSVYDARMARIFRSAKSLPEVIGGPIRIGKVMTYAGLFEMTERMRSSIAEGAGIIGSVLENPQPLKVAA